MTREHWLEVLGNVCDRFNWVENAYGQMTDHYHVFVETVDGHLSLECGLQWGFEYYPI